MIDLLFVLLIVCVVIWVARSLMAAFGVGEPINTVVYVVLVLICLLYLANAAGFGGRLPSLR